MRHSRFICIFSVSSALLFNCTDTDDIETYSSSKQAINGSDTAQLDAGTDAQVNEMLAPPGHRHLPPQEVDPSAAKTSPFALDGCPNDKKNRPDWAELERAKADRKQLRASGLPIPDSLPAPSASHLLRQAQFQDSLEHEREKLWAMPDEERQQAYYDLKHRFLTEE